MQISVYNIHINKEVAQQANARIKLFKFCRFSVREIPVDLNSTNLNALRGDSDISFDVFRLCCIILYILYRLSDGCSLRDVFATHCEDHLLITLA